MDQIKYFERLFLLDLTLFPCQVTNYSRALLSDLKLFDILF